MIPPRLPSAATPPDLVVDGRRIHFVWNPPSVTSARRADGNLSVVFAGTPSIPKGALIHHQAPDGTDCVMWVPWAQNPAHPEDERWTLLSLHPLSVREPFMCGRCRTLGGIREGRWWVAWDEWKRPR